MVQLVVLIHSLKFLVQQLSKIH